MPENEKLYTYTDLDLYWDCPRRWWYHRQGWRPYEIPNPMLRGWLAHKASAASWAREDPRLAVANAVVAYGEDLTAGKVGNLQDKLAQAKLLGGEALNFNKRYHDLYAEGFIARGVEKTIAHSDGPRQLGGTPDAILKDVQGRNYILELKTGNKPDVEALEMSGQADYYAHLADKAGIDIHLIKLALVSPDLVTEYVRPPRLQTGQSFYASLGLMATRHEQEPLAALHSPHPGWQCPRCPYFDACRTREDGGDDGEVLELTCRIEQPNKYIREVL